MAARRDYVDIAARALARLKDARAFGALPPDERRRLAHDVQKVVRFLRRRGGEVQTSGEPQGELVADVDFPRFVDALVNGTFKAIVDSSVEQMEAYASLVEAAARSVDLAREDDPRRLERDRERVAIALLGGMKRASHWPP